MRTWLPIQRTSKFSRIPWGYEIMAEDCLTLVPKLDLLAILEEGLKLADEGVSWTRVAEYITQKSGTPISSVTVRKYYLTDPNRAERIAEREKLVANYRAPHLRKKRLTKAQKIVKEISSVKRSLVAKQKALEKIKAESEAKAVVETPAVVDVVPAEPKPDQQPVKTENIIMPNPGPQTQFLAASERCCLFGGSSGGGKQLRINTYIPTTYGFKLMQDIKVGDFVFRDNGEPVRVIWKSDIDYNPEAYEVEFDTGEVITCDARHLWKTLTEKERLHNARCTPEWRAKRRSKRPSRAKTGPKNEARSAAITKLNKEREYICNHIEPVVRTTKELFETQLHMGFRSNHSIPVAAPIATSKANLPVPPYLFGVWLGDGASKAGCIGMAEADIRELEPYFNWDITNRYVVTKNRKTPFCTYTFKRLVTALKTLGLYGNKHIPYLYLRASEEQRKEVLRGIMDTDGTVDKLGKCSVMFMNKRLAEDTLELICSLGIKAAITTKEAKIKSKSYGTAYRICFNPTFPVFKLKRKLDRQVMAVRPTNFMRYIKSIRKCDPVPMQCIQVDHPDGMYCIGRTFIPTHNSWAIVVDPLRTAHMQSHRAITFRKTYDDLRDLISMTKEIYPKVIPGAKFDTQKSTWYFPNGGTHWYRYLDKDDDVASMQGQAFTWVGFDELTQWASPYVFNYMRSRLRTADKDIRPYLSIRATSNPGNVGAVWVKKFFVDPAPWNTPFPAIDIETGNVMVHKKGPKAGQPLFYCRFIPAKLSDNPYLTADDDYETNLLSLPEVLRKQLLEGNWDIVEGSAFPEFMRDVHTCAPFEIPYHWKKFRAGDWGYQEPHCVLWFAEDEYGRLYVYRELYNKLVTSSDLADRIVAAEAGEDILYGVLDSSCWHVRDKTPSTADIMRSRACFWRPADRSPGSRVSGKQEIHRRLQVKTYKNKDTGQEFQSPSIIIFNTCTNLIRTFPMLPLDKTNPEDVDTKAEDHAYDAFRYGCASRPMHRNNRVTANIFSPVPERTYDAFGFPT